MLQQLVRIMWVCCQTRGFVGSGGIKTGAFADNNDMEVRIQRAGTGIVGKNFIQRQVVFFMVGHDLFWDYSSHSN